MIHFNSIISDSSSLITTISNFIKDKVAHLSSSDKKIILIALACLGAGIILYNLSASISKRITTSFQGEIIEKKSDLQQLVINKNITNKNTRNKNTGKNMDAYYSMEELASKVTYNNKI